MKLRNKKTGEIVKCVGCTAKGMRIFLRFEDLNGVFKFEVNSLAELNEKWEDYEEPKEYWCFDVDGNNIYKTEDKEWDGYMPSLSWMIDKDLNLLFGGEE